MGITEEKRNKNYLLWIEYLKKYNCYSSRLIEDYGELIKNSSFAMNETSGGAYQGSLLDVILYTLCPIASHINDCAFGMNEKQKMKHHLLHVEKESLMKVLLLQHISKADIFVPTSEQWKKNKGMYYDFNNNLATALKLGERSIFMCMKYDIELTEEEYDAMKILDKDDDKTNSFISPLSEIVKIANQCTAIELYRKNNENKIN